MIDTVPAPMSLSAVIFSRASPASHCWTTLLLTIQMENGMNGSAIQYSLDDDTFDIRELLYSTDNP